MNDKVDHTIPVYFLTSLRRKNFSEEDLWHESSEVVHLETRQDGTLDKSVPRYIPMASPLTKHSPEFTVKITDLGAGEFFHGADN